ncbi:PDE [Ceraceosorus bombacis]|uniref:PDE n=1 Tax=Ceraceosorus bombacis TaxID=401625 RepID=A0A0P1BGI0_9BASI|nr:PDE [Ceraceosorus bombacis]
MAFVDPALQHAYDGQRLYVDAAATLNSLPRAPEKAAHGFEIVCLGVGGGPLETDCSCYAIKTRGTSWLDSYVVIEGGSWLGGMSRVLELQASHQCAGFGDLALSSSPPSPANVSNPSGWTSKASSSSVSSKVEYLASRAEAFLISHAHLDHTYGLILASAVTSPPKPVYALESPLTAFEGIFGTGVWPSVVRREHSPEIAQGVDAGMKPPRTAQSQNAATDTGVGYVLRVLQPRRSQSLTKEISVLAFELSHGLCAACNGKGSGSANILAADHAHTASGPHERLRSTAFFLTNVATGQNLLLFGDVETDRLSRTDLNYQVWMHASEAICQGRLSTIMIECSFDSSQPEELLFGHMNPAGLYEELKVLARLVAIRTNTEHAGRRDRALQNHAFSRTTEMDDDYTAKRGAKALQGLIVVVTHVKASISPAKRPSADDFSAVHVPLEVGPHDMRDQIFRELLALEEKFGLGVRFVMAVQGMKIDC